MAEQFIVVPDSFFSAVAILDGEEAAIEAAAKAVERDKRPRLIVHVKHLVRPRSTPNVDVVPVTSMQQPEAEAANG